MKNSARNWWIGGAIVVVLIVLITWAGTRPEEVRQSTSGTSVAVSAPPVSGRAGSPVPLTWGVQAPVGAIATHTATHWGTSSTSGELGTEVAPGSAGYPNLLPDYAQGSFALPRTFTGAVTFPSTGTYYYRAHAIIDGKNYWSPEYSVVVQ
ncbi:hypothetical protein HY634_03715 [Candidatus Uhrbacteria bacterium]|nr:hypothetical protein [Candidatus Uhrbacteria bacterium]